MKLSIPREWCIKAAKREGDFDVGACSPEIAARARDLAKARGYRNVDELITCAGGAQLAVWQFYIDEAALSAAFGQAEQNVNDGGK